MKKGLLLFVLMIYLATVSGAGLVFHYCGGEFDSFSLGGQDSETCTCGKTGWKKSCCSNRVVVLQIRADQNIEGNLTAKSLLENAVSFLFPELNVASTALFNYRVTGKPASKGPPGKERCLIYLRWQVFRI